jgi:malate synthase
VNITAKDLLAIPTGNITEEGLRWNIDVGLQYLASWLDGNGCVPIYNLMEDAATAEISRAQDWQWVRHGAKLQSGEKVTAQMVRETTASVLEKLKAQLGAEKFNSSKLPAAGKILVELMTSPEFHEFLTLDAYAELA